MVNDESDAGTGRLRLVETACRFPHGPGAVARLCREMALLILRWWRAGRIRVSPREGELLRLQPGDLVLFGEHRLQVQRRRTVQPAYHPAEAAGLRSRSESPPAGERPLPEVVLCCEDDLRQHWQLRVRIPAEATEGLCGTTTLPVVQLTDSTGAVQFLPSSDLTVYSRVALRQPDLASDGIPAPGGN